MQSHTVRFHVDAPPRKVWRVLHPPVPANAPRPRVLEWPTGSMEILNEGDEAGEGLVRICVFPLPRYLLSGGKGRSWETVVEAKINAFNPVLRFLLERPVHAKISRDNVEVYEHALRNAGPVQRLAYEATGR